MQASIILDRVSRVLNDESRERWTLPALLSFLTAAQRQLVLVRPEAASIVSTVQLVPGTKQALPSDGLYLVALIRNMGSNGVTPGEAIQLTTKSAIDAFNLDWHTVNDGSEIYNYWIDDRFPRSYYVYPKVPSSPAVYVELAYVKNPSTLDDVTDSIDVLDVYENCLFDYVMYLCLSMDTEDAGHNAKAKEYLQSFASFLGIKLQGDRYIISTARGE